MEDPSACGCGMDPGQMDPNGTTMTDENTCWPPPEPCTMESCPDGWQPENPPGDFGCGDGTTDDNSGTTDNTMPGDGMK